MPGKNHVFTTRVDPVSPPSQTSAFNERALMVEAPGTAPGSAASMPQGVYRHSWASQRCYYTGRMGRKKGHSAFGMQHTGEKAPLKAECRMPYPFKRSAKES